MFEPGSITGGTITLAVACVGVGTVAFPLAFAAAGIVQSTIFLFIIGIFTIFSIRHMAFGVEVLKLGSYEDMSRLLLGSVYETAVRAMLISHNFGVAVGYIVVIAEMLVVVKPQVQSSLLYFSGASETFVASSVASKLVCTHHLHGDGVTGLQQLLFDTACSSQLNNIILCLFWLVLLFPLSLAKTMDSLRFASSMAILSTCFIMGCVVYRYFEPFVNTDAALLAKYQQNKNGVDDVIAPPHVDAFRFNFMTLLALPIMMYSLDCQCFVFQIYNDLSSANGNRTMHGITTVGFWATIVACSFFLGVGVFGALSFGDKTKGNILQNYDPLHDPLFGVGFLLYSFPVVMAFVFTLFPCRDAFFNAIYGLNSSSFEITATAPTSPTTKKPKKSPSTEDATTTTTSVAVVVDDITTNVKKNSEEEKESSFPSGSKTSSSGGKHLPPNVTPEMVPVYPSYHHAAGSSLTSAPTSGATSHLPKFPEIILPHSSVVIGSKHHHHPSPVVSDDNMSLSEDEEDDGAFYMTPTTFYLWSTAMSFLALLVAIITPGIVVIIGLLGAMCSSTLCFTYPALYRLAMDKHDLVPFYRTSTSNSRAYSNDDEELTGDDRTSLLSIIKKDDISSAAAAPTSYGAADNNGTTTPPGQQVVVPSTTEPVGREVELATLLADPECRLDPKWWMFERETYGELYFYFYIRFERELTYIMLWLGIIGCVLGTAVASYKVALGEEP